MQDAQDSGLSQREQSSELGAARVYYSAPPGGTANVSQARSPATGQLGRPNPPAPCNRAHTLVVMDFLHLKICWAENSHFMCDSKLPPASAVSQV